MKELILKNNYINYKNISEEDLHIISNNDNVYFWDTECCADMPQTIVDEYDLTQVDYSNIEGFDEILKDLHRDKSLLSKVYVWMFGCNNSNKVYWGNTIEQFMEFIQAIDTYKVLNGDKEKQFEIYVHNLSWDTEHLKYYLKDNDFTQTRINPDNPNKFKQGKKPKTFDIVESEGIVHNTTITLDSHKAGRKKVISSMIFRDSMKITPLSLKKISEQLIDVDDIYIKNSDVYKYNIVRDVETYVPNVVEGWYQYCDIYLLKEWYNQFVQKMYIDNGIKPYTISQISFDSVLELSYAKDKKEGKYDHLMDKKGRIKNRHIYEEHFALGAIENNPKYKEYLELSYKGGITTCSNKYKEKALNNELKGVSIDITSSYPSACINKPLPYGVPTEIKEGKYEDTIILGKKYDFHFITIGFDGWISKNKENQFGLPVKINGLTDDQKESLGYTPNEVYPTNMVDYTFIGSNRIAIENKSRKDKIDKLSYKYIVTLTNYEYECWSRMFNFVRYENNELEMGVHFIDYISFQSEIGYFAEGLNHYFNMKNEGTKTGNKAMEYNAKILVNSFYGKNASRRDREQRFYDFSKDVIGLQSITEENRNEWIDSKAYAVHYASAVTSWGRINLMDTANKIGSDKFIYADTDSLKFEITKEELIAKCKEEGIELSLCKEDKKLGDWDFEYEFEDFKAIAQKKYVYKKKGNKDFICKCSGLPKDIRDSITTKEQFNIGESWIKFGKTKVRGGNLLLPTEFTINDLTIL